MSKVTWKIVWQGERDALNLAETLLSEVWFPPTDAASLMKDDAAKEESVADWRLEAYFQEKPDLQALDQFLNEHGADVKERMLEEVPDIDWVAHALEGLGIVEAGDFVLYGIHDQDRLPKDQELIPIRIDANLAFGTGHHPTTAGCLEILKKIQPERPKNLLDVGTGSAVLAIAAAKLWQCPVLATDIDEDSVHIAANNGQYNDVTGIDFLCAAGFDHADISARAPYDFIFANILAGPLKELAPDMAAHAAPGATVILAGLLADQETGVLEAYSQAGFSLIHRLDHQTWPVLALEKN